MQKASAEIRPPETPVNPSCPAEDELREWAYAPDSEEPVPDFGLILSWQMDRGLLRRCIQFADDRHCPQAPFFLDVLYLWGDAVASASNFAETRSIYDEWLEVARGITDPAVKCWRHHARLIFQGLEPFDRDKWWKLARSDGQNGT
jgi:hypothetical protein